MDTWSNMKFIADERIKDAYGHADNQRLAKVALLAQPSRLANLLRSDRLAKKVEKLLQNLHSGDPIRLDEPVALVNQHGE